MFVYNFIPFCHGMGAPFGVSVGELHKKNGKTTEIGVESEVREFNSEAQYVD